MVYNGVMRGLQYIHSELYINEHSKDEVSSDPATVALKLVYLFDKYIALKLKASNDEILRIQINFVGITSRFMMLKEATAVGNSLMVESLYN